MTRGRRSVMLVLAYLGILGLIPLWGSRSDQEIRWHARNGLLLFAAVCAIALGVTFVGIAAPSFSCVNMIVIFFLVVFYAVIVLLAIVKAIEGQRLMIPGISRLADRP